MVNVGTQTVNPTYGQNANTSTLAKQFYSVLQQGIYSGGLVSITDAPTHLVSIAVFNCIVQSASHETVRIETALPVPVTISELTPYIVGSYSWVNATDNYMSFSAKALGDIYSNDIVFGKGVYVASVLTSINYDDKTWGLASGGDIHIPGALYMGSEKVNSIFDRPKITTVAPTVTDDSSEGYYQGFQWFNTSGSGSLYIAASVDIGNAIWRRFIPA